MKLIIQLVLILASSFIGYLIYDSIASKIELEKEIEHRKSVVIERLEQIKEAQLFYKKIRGEYANSFDQLKNFLENDSITIINATGVIPDSLLGQEAKAIALGIIVRDTSKIAVKEQIFKDNFSKIVDSLAIIPFSGGKQFTFNFDEIEKKKVFEVVAPFVEIYKDLKTEKVALDINQSLIMGSMKETSIKGNWE